MNNKTPALLTQLAARDESEALLDEIREGAAQIQNRCIRAATTRDPELARVIFESARRRMEALEEETGQCMALHRRADPIEDPGLKPDPRTPRMAALYQGVAQKVMRQTQERLRQNL